MMPRKPQSPDAALQQMAELCNRGEYSSGEIRSRLMRKGLSSADIDRIIDILTDRRLIDDARFARMFVHDKIVFARWGRRKIALALYQKKVGRQIIADVLADIDMNEYKEALEKVIEAKMRSLGLTAGQLDYESRAKVFRYAASRGFEPDLISRFL